MRQPEVAEGTHSAAPHGTDEYPRKFIRNAFLAGLFFRLFMAWHSHGFKQMDEHWQVFEPAMSLVDGIWFRSREWEIGDRSWIYPWLVSLCLKISHGLGVRNPLHLASIVRSVHGVIGSFAVPLAAQLTWFFCQQTKPLSKNHQTLARLSTIICAWFVALWPFAVYCGFHAHGEMAGALSILGAVVALSRRRPALAGALFGLAFMLKIDVAVAGLMAGLWLLLNRRWRDAFTLALAAIPFALLVGLVDKLTWGTWFQNVRSHAHVNLVEEIGNQWGVSPWYEHLYFLVTMGSAPLLLSLFALPKAWKRLSFELKTAWFMTLGFVAVFSYVSHKEKRFMAPLIYLAPVLGLSTLVATRELWERSWRRGPAVFKGMAGLLALAFMVHLGAEIRNYVLYDSWEERVVALTNAGLIPDSEKMLSFQWPAFFYFPRHIPATMSDGTREAIRRDTEGYRVVSIAMDGNHLGWMEENGFRCTAWPKPRRISKDPVPTAYRCERATNNR